jgi:hypothetical protein
MSRAVPQLSLWALRELYLTTYNLCGTQMVENIQTLLYNKVFMFKNNNIVAA